MMTIALPAFIYHPDPIKSGSVEISARKCLRCGRTPGLLYSGPVYSENRLDNAICPWCIADGSAHERFGVTFTDAEMLPGGISDEAAQILCCRTPGFSTWQGSRWLACCNDAAAFLEPVGYADIANRYPKSEGNLVGYLVHELGISGRAAIDYLRALNRISGPTAYIFQCRHCDAQPIYADSP